MLQASLRSEGSSDSENYVMIGGESGGIDRPFDASDAMFRVASYADSGTQRVEMASEVVEEEPSGTIVTTPSERADSIDSSIKRRDLVLQFLVSNKTSMSVLLKLPVFQLTSELFYFKRYLWSPSSWQRLNLCSSLKDFPLASKSKLPMLLQRNVELFHGMNSR